MDTDSAETLAGSSPPAATDRGGFTPGTVLAGRYRIVALVGRGGMGEVYRADDLRLGQPVALKFLPTSLQGDAAARERLLAEIRSARMVSHPNVCRVYDFGELEGGPGIEAQGPGQGRVFLTMEYIDGEDLASLLRRIGRLPAAKALEVARQLCAGLAAAHDKGLLHRDLKPANVMIDGRGQARITDFGLAAEPAPDGSPADYAGTVSYLAPERFAGRPATVQTDLYALGLILYETCTGKPAFKAGSWLEWRQMHTDSKPESPSLLAADVEPAVERAILRCLEKDPAKRPTSAAQVAAALPGGDPLAAAIAAGETPSPELVAASGEEGTLPRGQAWLWFGGCLAALVVVPLTLIPFSLAEHVPFDRGPGELQARAGEILSGLGYPDKPADRVWWFRTDDDHVERLNGMRASEAEAAVRTAAPGPLLFCHRQGPATLVPWAANSAVSGIDPPPEAGDAYVELDLRGRLVALRVKPPAYGEAQPSSGLSWTALLAAGGLGAPDAFAPVAPLWWPDAAADVREAREGTHQGQGVRVEAAARGGRPVFFQLLMPWTTARRPAGTPFPRTLTAPLRAWSLAFWTSLVVLAVLARRNLRLGRSDRAAARTLALACVVAWTAIVALRSPTATASLDLLNRPGLLAQPLMFGLFAWLGYLGFEPQIRRASPHLLITSTRLLNGRWRDPLVGRAVLAGILVGLLFSLPASLSVCRWLDRPGGGPTDFTQGSLDGLRSFLASGIFCLGVALVWTLVCLTVLLAARLIARRTDAAWAVFALLMVGYGYLLIRGVRPATISPLLLLAMAAVFWLLLVWLLWKHGALALAVGFSVLLLVPSVPWTLDPSRWYAWRGPFVMSAVGALAFWGFRNVLGRQSAFPAGALDV